MIDDNEPYNVGYKKPPVSTQFKAGQSGNAKGRPRGAKNFDTVIVKELEARVDVNENGRRRSITKREAIGKQMINKAASGDSKFVTLLLGESRRIEERKQPGNGSSVFDTPEDALVLKTLLARLRSSSADGDAQ